MNDATFPWLILVPMRADLSELIDLDGPDRAQLTGEIDDTARALREITGCDKLNIAALGNMVRQLHIHVIARFEADPAWPGPVWGKAPPQPYADGARQMLIGNLRRVLKP